MMIKSRELKLAWLLLLIDTFPSWFNEPYEWQLQLIFIGLHSGQKSIEKGRISIWRENWNSKKFQFSR